MHIFKRGACTMEFRKVIQFGKNSLVISLPNYWILRNKLKKGDSVSIEDQGNDIVVSSGKIPDKETELSTTINTEGKGIDLIKVEIISSYLHNYERIEIVGSGVLKYASDIREVVRSLSGLEIVDQTSSSMVAKDILDESSISIKVMVRRIDTIIRGMIADGILSIRDNQYKSIYERDLDVNRLVFLTFRVLRNCLINSRIAKSLELEPVDILKNWNVVRHLEQIGDYNKRIARNLQGIRRNNYSKLKHLYRQIEKNYVLALESYYNDDKEIAFQLEIGNSAMMDELDNYLKKNHTTAIVRVIDNLKAFQSSIRYIARNIIGE